MFRPFAILLTVGIAIVRVRADEMSPIPMEKGVQWVYKANVEWTPMASLDGPHGVQKDAFEWTAEVVESFSGKGVRAAAVHAWPDEAGGMDGVKPTGYDVLLNTSNRIYRIPAPNKKTAVAIARRLVATGARLPYRASVYLELPLTVNKRWGDKSDDLAREDGWYCWRVESKEMKTLRIGGSLVSKGEVFTVAYRTNPSHELIEIVPGLGIVGYQFEHHGTVASADVRLLKIKR